MPKAKLRVPKNEGKKFQVSAHVNGVSIGVAKPFGDSVITEVTYPSAQSLYDLGKQQDSFKGDELDEKKDKGVAKE